MRLSARLDKLEDELKNDDLVVYSVFSGENAIDKKQTAWDAYIANGGRQPHEATMFVQINKI